MENVPELEKEKVFKDFVSTLEGLNSSSRDDDGNLYMSKLSVDIFAQKIEYICDKLGYKKRTRQENKDHLSTLVKVTPR